MRIKFAKFWDRYGLKRNRIKAESAWNKLSDEDRCAAFAGIDRYRKECQRTGIAMMYPQGYLNYRRWEDEIDEEAAGKHLVEEMRPQDSARQLPLFASEYDSPLEGMDSW